jgi:hypothetical protein
MKHRIVLLGTLAALLGSTVLYSSAYIKAQDKPQNAVETQGREIKPGGRGTEVEIPALEDTNKPNAPQAAPPDKGGASGRGGVYSSRIYIDNRTGWYIRLYFNDEYAGTSYPWGDNYISVTSGRAKLYAIAKFDDGTYVAWGPQYISIDPNEVWTWTLK